VTPGDAAGAMFVSLAAAPGHVPGVVLLENSIRRFGGPLRGSRMVVFQGSPGLLQGAPFEGPTEVVTLDLPVRIEDFPFAAKVSACAAAETVCGGEGPLVWMSHDTLVVNPPLLMVPGEREAAAVRPVHVRNVGIPPGIPPDPFWRGLYDALGVDDVPVGVESFVDSQPLRAYYNSHALSVNPAEGIFGRWLTEFAALVNDGSFQRGPCADPLHRIFLHQAVLSTILAWLPEGSVRILPPAYGYPYNLHGSVPPGRRAAAMEDLVSFAYEDRTLDPGKVDDIAIGEPLRGWLLSRTPG
jgi:hypothetical protein